MSDFKIYNSDYGQFVVNQYCKFQGEALETTGKTHIEEELERMYLIIDSLSDGAVVIDGGANIGFVTVPLSRRLESKSAKILSFEAQKRLFYALAGTVAINDLYNVHVYNQALGDTIGVVRMPDVNYHEVDDYGSVSIDSEVPAFDYTDPNLTQMVTIDSLNLPKVDFIKLDVEGYEPNAIRGAAETIKAHRPWLWVEYNNCQGSYIHETIKAVVNEIAPDYSHWFITDDGQNMICAPNEKLSQVNLPYITDKWRGW
jgi:FkbM family methyltransferase